VESLVSVVASVLPAVGTLTVVPAATPLPAPRTLVVDITDADNSITAGTLTVSGTVAGASVSRTFDLTRGGRQHGTDFWTSIASATIAGLTGGTGADRISIGTSEGYLEYHTLPAAAESFELLDRPLAHLLTVHESSQHVWDSSTLLVEGTDYATSKSNGRVTRLSSGDLYVWDYGWRTIRVAYSAGYSSAAVPEDLKLACLELAALIWKQQDLKTYGVSGMANELGNWTRYKPVEIAADLASKLEQYRRTGFGVPTGDRPTLDGEDC
jgi:hypothetical protein